MAAQPGFVEPPGLRVTVDEVIYQPDVPTPVDRPHCFVYFISIHNDTNVAVTIKGRKWIVTNAHGEISAVEGDGVVGQFPTIPPGDKFSYNSFHLLDTRTGLARGSYLGLDANGQTVVARIPAFKLAVPDGALL
jgi:ApaG protein